MSNWIDNAVVAGSQILRRSDGAVLGAFSSPSAAHHVHAQVKEGNRVSARWQHPGRTTVADRTLADALPARP